MDNVKWMIAVMLIIAGALTVPLVGWDAEKTDVSVWVGEEVELECGHNSSDPDIRAFWGTYRVNFTFVNGVEVNDDRISLANDSTTLRIVNASTADEDRYLCTLNTEPPIQHLYRLFVRVMFCEAPTDLAGGKYKREIYRFFDRPKYPYKRGERAIYSCDPGYKMIGQAIVTCSGTPKSWVPELPRCELEFLDPLLKRLESIEDQLSVINRRLTKVENNQPTDDNQTSSLAGIKPQINSTLD